MTSGTDRSNELIAAVSTAAEAGTALCIRGGASKAFYGRSPTGEPLDVAGHRGIVSYEPTELVLTARAGTRLRAIEAELRKADQMMPFEPPHFSGGRATLGGAIATGLSGPARPWTGSARDFVLGIRLINGRGEHLRFGGEVMKNVAGYDIARLATGSLGMLGVLTEISLKVLPRPAATATRTLELPAEQGFAQVEEAYCAGAPVTAAMHDGERLYIRLGGTQGAVDAGLERLGGDHLGDADAFWTGLRDHTLPFFLAAGPPLWRISLPPQTPPPRLPGTRILDWNGQTAWHRTEADAASVFAATAECGGHATLFRGGPRDANVFQPLPHANRRLHEHIKAAFDPGHICNPGRMYEGL